jgi:hypothetical protein
MKNGEITYTEWTRTSNLILNGNSNDLMYEVRLDETKTYSIKFRR